MVCESPRRMGIVARNASLLGVTDRKALGTGAGAGRTGGVLRGARDEGGWQVTLAYKAEWEKRRAGPTAASIRGAARPTCQATSGRSMPRRPIRNRRHNNGGPLSASSNETLTSRHHDTRGSGIRLG